MTWNSGSMAPVPEPNEPYPPEGHSAATPLEGIADTVGDLFTIAEGSESTLESIQGTLEGLTEPAGRIADALEALVKLSERSTVALERMQDHAQFGPGW
jgi:hypothetical protein